MRSGPLIEDSLTGVSVAVNFPVLLHELNKSAFEILLMHSIPSDFSEKELMYYYAIADNYTEEFWHYYLGPELWTSLLQVINKSDSSIADVIMMFSKLSYEELSNFCINCVEDKERALRELRIFFDY